MKENCSQQWKTFIRKIFPCLVYVGNFTSMSPAVECRSLSKEHRVEMRHISKVSPQCLIHSVISIATFVLILIKYISDVSTSMHVYQPRVTCMMKTWNRDMWGGREKKFPFNYIFNLILFFLLRFLIKFVCVCSLNIARTEFAAFFHHYTFACRNFFLVVFFTHFPCYLNQSFLPTAAANEWDNE